MTWNECFTETWDFFVSVSLLKVKTEKMRASFVLDEPYKNQDIDPENLAETKKSK